MRAFAFCDLARGRLEEILEQFPIVRRKDEERYGTYRTKEVILQCYDAMLRGMS